MDMFRSDSEDNNWYLDYYFSINIDFFKTLKNNNLKLLFFNDLRTTNPLKLRSTTKNAIVTYSAIQKVFKPRYDEGRSNSRLTLLSNSYYNYMYLTDNRPKFESLLTKNNESFFTPIFYNNIYKDNFTILNNINSSLNIFYFNIPFLLSFKSDSSRYL